MWQQIMAAVRAAIDAIKNGGKWVGRQVWDGTKMVTKLVYEPGKAAVMATTALAGGALDLVSAPFKALGGGGGGAAPQGPSAAQQAREVSEMERDLQKEAADKVTKIQESIGAVQRLAGRIARGMAIEPESWNLLPEDVREPMTRYLKALQPSEARILHSTDALLVQAWMSEQTSIPGIPQIREVLNGKPVHDPQVPADPNYWSVPKYEAPKPGDDADDDRVLAIPESLKPKKGLLQRRLEEARAAMEANAGPKM